MGPPRDERAERRSTRVLVRESEAAAPSALCWPGMAFDRDRVRALGMPAYCWTPDGGLWEFEDGTFHVTGRGDRGRRRRVDDDELAPFEGWSHPADCDCPACRVARY
jgi:hypothetical protein